jgi:hypothetical protein
VACGPPAAGIRPAGENTCGPPGAGAADGLGGRLGWDAPELMKGRKRTKKGGGRAYFFMRRLSAVSTMSMGFCQASCSRMRSLPFSKKMLIEPTWDL